ncbi:hypothetical protein [Leifsonia sp. NPDC077715]|uniref:hypothetical protein n=1 Tax=Leifsonia sp. NPDC077715 TaxID=3155539 RepID=UPI00342B196F
MTADNARSDGEKRPSERAGLGLGKWIWMWPPLLTLLFALGVSAWGVGFGVGAIAVLGAGIVAAIAYEVSKKRSPLWALALGAAAGILLYLLAMHQSALVFGSSPTVGASSTSTPTPTESATNIICTPAVERNLSGASSLAVTGSITGLPSGAKVTTVVKSDGSTLASEDSYPNGEGIATLDLAIRPAPSGAVSVRSEVRIGPQVLQTCQW